MSVVTTGSPLAYKIAGAVASSSASACTARAMMWLYLCLSYFGWWAEMSAVDMAYRVSHGGTASTLSIGRSSYLVVLGEGPVCTSRLSG